MRASWGVVVASLLLGVVIAAEEDLVRPQRIVGGEPVGEGNALWQVSIQGTLTNHHFCAGTLIADSWVLTAAHCTFLYPAEYIRIATGITTLADATDFFNVVKILRNEKFRDTTMENDIALLKIERKTPSRHPGTPIALETNENLSARDCYITGFGRMSSHGVSSKVLRSAKVPLVNLTFCQKAFPQEAVNQGHICAGGGSTDACQGDSGGPMVSCNDGVLQASHCTMVGVTSWGIGCATPGKPGVYTRVAHYAEWINKTIHAYELSVAM